MSACHTLPLDCLKTSEHLPLLVDMMYVPSQEDLTEGALSQGIDWTKLDNFGDYMNTVRSHLVPLLNTSLRVHRTLIKS